MTTSASTKSPGSPSKLARIALLGDYDPAVVAHQAIVKCFALAGASGSMRVEPVWMATDTIAPGDRTVFEGFQGIWVVPASPYRNTAGALWGIEFARTRQRPFLGTCGGFQHAVLEYVQNVLGLKDAEHAELNPDAAFPLLHRMRCSLVGKSQRIVVTRDGQFRRACGGDDGIEEFHCSYGLNPEHEALFRSGPLEIVARSEDGEVRAVELRGHPFFIATLFQPERRALTGSIHPLVAAFFAACLAELKAGNRTLQ